MTRGSPPRVASSSTLEVVAQWPHTTTREDTTSPARDTQPVSGSEQSFLYLNISIYLYLYLYVHLIIIFNLDRSPQLFSLQGRARQVQHCLRQRWNRVHIQVRLATTIILHVLASSCPVILRSPRPHTLMSPAKGRKIKTLWWQLFRQKYFQKKMAYDYRKVCLFIFYKT